MIAHYILKTLEDAVQLAERDSPFVLVYRIDLRALLDDYQKLVAIAEAAETTVETGGELNPLYEALAAWRGTEKTP